jgi:hypothetical protein
LGHKVPKVLRDFKGLKEGKVLQAPKELREVKDSKGHKERKVQ